MPPKAWKKLEEKKRIMVELKPNELWIQVTLYRDKSNGEFTLDIRNFIEAKSYIGLTKQGVRMVQGKVDELIEAVQVCRKIIEAETGKTAAFYGRGETKNKEGGKNGK